MLSLGLFGDMLDTVYARWVFQVEKQHQPASLSLIPQATGYRPASLLGTHKLLPGGRRVKAIFGVTKLGVETRAQEEKPELLLLTDP